MRRRARGLVQVYTGCGKGKTTAALGLALRTAGANQGVYIMQFIKGRSYSELKTLKRIKKIKIEQCGRGCFIGKSPRLIDVKCARAGLSKAQENIMSGKFRLVILDEVNIAVRLGLLKIKDLVELINGKPKKVELVLTGRNCPYKIKKLADLVTDMREVKHPYQRGIKARLGIEY